MSKYESFTFETVMSHRDKVTLLKSALEQGYRTYLYYICTEDVRINLSRVANRAAQGGHGVLSSVVTERYQRSLALLSSAIRFSTRAYLFDNSGKEHRLVAEYLDGKPVRISQDSPQWLIHHVLSVKAKGSRRR